MYCAMKGPQLIVCRHEQNAAFMAAAIGRLTGRSAETNLHSAGLSTQIHRA
jgi:thiamine pyrophosphate-dependent acetolactate synthase large subunit-like protein